MSGEEHIRVLPVEDSRADAAVVRGMLRAIERPKFELHQERSLREGLRALRRSNFRLILPDLVLPDSAGLASFVQSCPRASRIPIVVLTSIDDEPTALEALRQGAQDYLVKGCFDVWLFVRTMLYAVERKRAEHQIGSLQRQLATLSKRQQQRVAQQLHDGLGQHLAGVALMARRLERRLAVTEFPLAVAAGEPASLVLEARRQLRSAVKGIYRVEVGKGFESTPRQGEGMGLRIMRRRAEAIGAWLSIGAAHPHGALITCQLPGNQEIGNVLNA